VILSSVLVAAPGAPAAASDNGQVVVTSTVTRHEVSNGTDQVVDSRTVTLDVSQTVNLQGRQEVNVSWSGAHPTGGIVANQNSSQAQYEEYPMVLLECRGIDSTSVAPSQQLTPQTCWTQTWTERYQDSLDDTYPPYRLDEFAPSSDLAPIADAPNPLPATCNGDEDAPVQHWVPFVAANGTVYPGGNAGCAGEAPESNDVGGGALPSNETFGVTGTNGDGSANFDVFTTQQNASLGCTQGVACALVAVPIMGVSCNPGLQTNPPPGSSDITNCEATGAYAPGANANTGEFEDGADLSVTGALWWSASNWRNRITVPLTFAPPPNACALSGSTANKVVDVYGSEMMIQATTQWDPSFCLNSKNAFTVQHVQTGEPEARNLLATGGAEAAFTSYAQPKGYGKPVVNAPVAVTGFSIAYDVDGSNGQPYTTLKLSPRLLAKLLTESYPGEIFMKQEDTALANNPLNITEDPEFQALNPGINPIAIPGAASDAASELMALSSNSDVVQAVTTYINDDPTARAWLNGTPDQWGMVVNPPYKGMQLPVDQWPLLSSFEPLAYYKTDNNDCLFNNPVPWQPLVAAPLPTLEALSESVQYAKANSTIVCDQPTPDSQVGEKLVTDGQQTPGHQFMIAITPLADDQRYLLRTAALQTAGGNFVAPSDASMKAAAALLKPDPTSNTWPIPYPEFGQSSGASAYPGTMVVYAAVPTKGLPSADAQEYAAFLEFAAADGQIPGSGVGQLPPGYLSMTAANGLGSLAAYTQAAAQDVAAQNGQVPSVLGTLPGTTASSPSSLSTPTGFTSAFQGVLPFQVDNVLTPFLTGHPLLAGHKAGKGGHQITTEMVSSALNPAGLLWTSGFPVVLLFCLGALGALSVPLTFRLGRKRGRW
jgi:hypothetical protein